MVDSLQRKNICYYYAHTHAPMLTKQSIPFIARALSWQAHIRRAML